MSSFIGHSLAAVTIYLSSEPVIEREVSVSNNLSHSSTIYFRRLAWLFWLIIIASIPDLDYLIGAWQSSNNKIRIMLFTAISTILLIFLCYFIQQNLALPR